MKASHVWSSDHHKLTPIGECPHWETPERKSVHFYCELRHFKWKLYFSSNAFIRGITSQGTLFYPRLSLFGLRWRKGRVLTFGRWSPEFDSRNGLNFFSVKLIWSSASALCSFFSFGNTLLGSWAFLLSLSWLVSNKSNLLPSTLPLES